MKKSLKPLLCVLVLVMSVSLIMVFSSGGCRPAAPPVEEPIVEEPAVEEVTGEPEEALDESEEEEIVEETTTETTTAETTVNNDMELFRNAVKDYDILNKGLEYATENYQIAVDAVDKKLTDVEVGNRYMDLANKVLKDYFDLVILKEKILDKSGIQNITPEMKQIISLLIDWQDTVTKQYEYTAKYYQGEGGEFKIKADELQNEADKIRDEYIALGALGH